MKYNKCIVTCFCIDLICIIGLFGNIIKYNKVLDIIDMQTDMIKNLTEISKQHTNMIENLIKIDNVNDVEVEIPISEDEFNLVSRVVYAEARGESYEGQRLVAQVIKNRSELWDMSISDVVYSKGQFVIGDTTNESCTNAVYDVFVNNNLVIDEPITHFHAFYVKPSWVNVKTCVISEGNHIFYK